MKRVPVSFPGLIPVGPVPEEIFESKNFRRKNTPWLDYIVHTLGFQPAMQSQVIDSKFRNEPAMDTTDEEDVDVAVVQAVLDQMYEPRQDITDWKDGM